MVERWIVPSLVAAAVAVAVAAPPARADGASPQAALEDWAAQTQRLLETLQDAARPWTDALGAYLADPDAYHAPRTLPNGDIVIRRRADRGPQAPESGSSQPEAVPPLDL